ncbi:MAG TPA: hemolysin family protein [Gemmatimonadales bacterium]|nr:hemolysin family protein [Gemmatimonadales bacterium]
MIEALQRLIAPMVVLLLTFWAAWLLLAAEAEDELPRKLVAQLGASVGGLPLQRGLHVAHLILLAFSGVVAGGSVLWWIRDAGAAVPRLLIAVSFVWALGDLLPRVLAAVAPELTAPARRGAVATLLPLAPLLRLIARLDARMMPVAERGRRNSLGDTQRDMLFGVFALADMNVSEVMTPRIDVVGVDVHSTGEEVMQAFRRSEHARLLVFDGNTDAISGVVYAKDMLAAVAEDQPGADWRALVRPAVYVPEAKSLDRQLRDFQRGPAHLAVVVDEFGGTAGIVTLEDILEQVVGEIQDERDTEEAVQIQRVAEDHLRVQGGVPLAELEAELEHHFGREDVSTVGGLVLAELGRVPRAGERLRIGEYELTVEQMARRRVRRVSVRHSPEAAVAEEEA